MLLFAHRPEAAPLFGARWQRRCGGRACRARLRPCRALTWPRWTRCAWRRPAYLAVGMLARLVALGLVPATRRFFELAILSPLDWLLIGVVVTAWGLFLRFGWRANLFDRLLGLEVQVSPPGIIGKGKLR